jgi:hypothetical protein
MIENQVLDALHRIPFDAIELEFRLGSTHRTFVAGISEDAWTKALTHCENLEDAWTRIDPMTTTTDIIQGDYRVVQETETAIFKTKVLNIDVSDTTRLSVSSEQHYTGNRHLLHPTSKSFRREKSRTSFHTSEGFRIDFTKVLSLKDMDEDRFTFEIEVELADKTVLLRKPLDWVLHHMSKRIQDVLHASLLR